MFFDAVRKDKPIPSDIKIVPQGFYVYVFLAMNVLWR